MKCTAFQPKFCPLSLKTTIKKIYKFFTKPLPLALFNGILIAIITYCNFEYQAFCRPTTWAIVVIAICFTNTILYPLLEKTKIAPLTSFINGVSLCLFIYCVIFIGVEWTFMALIFILAGIGLILFIPHFFVVQLIRKNLVKPATKISRYFCLSAIILCLGISIYIGYDYNKALNSMIKFQASDYKELDKNFMTEKILGMHFIYHIRYCPYDGWRPPIHEPILVIGMWLNRYNPSELEFEYIDLETRLKLYKEFFPDKQYKFDCGCTYWITDSYRNDKLWK